MYKLVVIGGKLRGQEFVLEEGDNIMGRDPDCEVHLPIVGVSKRHASFSVTKDSCYMKDLGSINGTFVDGKLVKSKILQDKDMITLPDIIIQVVYVREKKKIIRKKIDIDDSEKIFYEGGAVPKDLVGKIFHFFKYKVMAVLHGINQEWEWRILFAILLAVFSISAVTLIIYPVLKDSKNLLLIETAKRGSQYADEISRINAVALERKEFSALNTGFLDMEEGVTSYELFDLQGRIIRPIKKLNEYIQDPFSNEAKAWAEKTINSDGNVTYKTLLNHGQIGIARKIMAFNTKLQRTAPVGIIAIIFEPATLKMEAIKNSKAYLEAIVTIGLVAILFFGIIYFLSFRPLEEMRFQIDEVLRGKRKSLESKYLMSEIVPLRGAINMVLQKIRELQNDGIDEEELEADTDYVNSLKEFMAGSGVPTLILDSQKNVQALNTEAEDLTGIRQSSAEGMNLLDVSREKGFSATVLEICENSANDMGSNQQSEYEISGIVHAIHVSALMGKDSFAKAFYITFIKE